MKHELKLEKQKEEEKILKEKLKQAKERTRKMKNVSSQEILKNKSENTANKENNSGIQMESKDLRPKDYEKIRKEMIEKFNNSKLKD